MRIHGEWQTCNNFLTIRECHSPNGNANDHHCPAQCRLPISGKWVVEVQTTHFREMGSGNVQCLQIDLGSDNQIDPPAPPLENRAHGFT